MILDALLTLAGSIVGNTVTPQTVTGTNTNVLSTNVIDLSTGGIPSGQVRDIGEGSDIPALRVEVMTAFAGATSVEFQAIQHDDTAQSTNVTVVGSTGAIPVASLVAGARFVAEINPRIASKGQRYLSGRFVIVGAGSAGAIFADIGVEIQDGQKFLPSGFAVL
ncbi:Bbp16 family capsid cement protein [Polynucleobacter sp. Fuers-14]|uniref:Bbp16 family capsid cement protein n=1 Tax=Polynucleobacter sp. Fuers-14 TaxID=1758364 RepID=UPI001C0B5485|nr:hypothetical protein [Polynucleobacter sp. Fuers-14]MBU3640521.1 hypothetical protein [Polynucleobacter sp. Fuers-14]